MKIGLLRESIGHTIINPIIYFSTFDVGNELHIFIYRGNKIDNTTAFEIVKLALENKFNVIFIDSNFIFRIIYNIFYRFSFFNYFKHIIISDIFNVHHDRNYEKIYKVKYKAWTNNPINLKFSTLQDNDVIFQKWKDKINLNNNFICIFSRDSTYHSDAIKSIRDTDFVKLIPSILYLINSGYQIVRMGRKHSNSPFINTILEPYKKSFKYYDYDSLNEIDDIFDIFLLKNCKYFISNNSGIIMPSYFFNTPLIIYDWVPSGVQPYFSNKSIYILKFYYYNGVLQKYENLPDEVKIVEDEEILNNLGYRIKGNSPNVILEFIKRSINTEFLDSISPPENMIVYGGNTKIDRVWYDQYIKKILI